MIQSLSTTVDFDLHGIVGIRLIDPSASDRAAVRRQLGPIESPLQRRPDVTIRFVDQLDIEGPLHYLGVDEVAYSPQAFFVLKGKHKSHCRVQIPFDRLGGPCELVCESGLKAVPLLVAIINLTALANDFVPVHAAAFSYQGVDALVTGWSKGGKTETLLAFMSRGANYIGDEWIYLSADGRHLHGIPEPLTMWDWHLRQLPHCRKAVPWSQRARLTAARSTLQSITWGQAALHRMGLQGGGVLDRIEPLIGRQLSVQMPPERVFEAGSARLSGGLDKVFLVSSHQSSETAVAAIEPEEVAQRMVFSLEQERQDLLSYYMRYRFAFPDRPNPLLEQTAMLQRTLLRAALAGKDAYAVTHPYPMSLERLFEVISPCLL